jgi:hypothetical protein
MRAGKWARRHRTALVITCVGVALAIAVWGIPLVHFIPVTRDYQVVVASGQKWTPLLAPGGSTIASSGAEPLPSCAEGLQSSLNFTPIYVGTVFVSAPSSNDGGTISGSFSDQNATPAFILVEFGDGACGSTNRSGSFDLPSGSVAIGAAALTVESPSPTSVYVNGSITVTTNLYGAL